MKLYHATILVIFITIIAILSCNSFARGGSYGGGSRGGYSSGSSRSSGSRSSYSSSSGKSSTSRSNYSGSKSKASPESNSRYSISRQSPNSVYKGNPKYYGTKYSSPVVEYHYYHYPAPMYYSGYHSFFYYNMWYHLMFYHPYYYYGYGGYQGNTVTNYCERDNQCMNGESCDVKINKCVVRTGSQW